MTGKAQPATPLSRLSRIVGVKNTSSGLPQDVELQDDEWYIPYTGPYEAPKAHGTTSAGAYRNNPFDNMAQVKESGVDEIEEKRGRSRRTRSTTSNSSSAVNLHHKHSSTTHVPARSSYVNLNQSDGIGDTPIPMQRTSAGQLRNRKSLTSFLSFGQSSRTRTTSSGSAVQTRSGIFRNSAGSSSRSHSKGPVRHSDPKTPTHNTPHGKQGNTSRSNQLPIERMGSRPQDASLEYAPAGPDTMSGTSRTISHPYATAFPVLQSVTSGTHSKGKERVAFVGQNTIPSHLRPSRVSYMRASVSTPDLRELSSPPLLKGKDHWFSAETWCDALLLPLPRFTVKRIEIGPKNIARRGRVVSPPPTPLSIPSHDHTNTKSLLKRSKSSADLQRSKLAATTEIARKASDTNTLEERRWRRHALDDMVIPSPVPSLATFVVNARNLQHEREAWNKLATGSIGNKRSRSLSRARSKSQSNMRRDGPQLSNESTLGFLAARTFLGYQAVPPVVHINPHTSSVRHRTPGESGSGFEALPRSSGSRSRSRSKSHGHSSSGGTYQEVRGHKHNPSLRAVFKKAKSAFGSSAEPQKISSDDGTSLEAALRSESTKVFTLSDWTNPREPNSASTNVTLNVSSSISIPSGEGVGLAISTPPSVAHSHSLEEPIRVPAHPYAQGANYSYAQPLVQPSSPDLSEGMSPTETGGSHRQRITHPYAPYGAHLSPSIQEGDPSSSKRKMFAQVSSGEIREILPDEIQYSPFVVNTPGLPVPTKQYHGLEDVSKRQSDTLRIGEVLDTSLRNRESPDSGLGASEDHHPFSTALAPLSPVTEVRRPVNPTVVDVPEDPAVLFPLPGKKTLNDPTRPERRPVAVETSPHPSPPVMAPHSSSGVDQVSPQNSLPLGDMVVSSSERSSLGVSHDSSPPASVHLIDRMDNLNLERFNDLFTKPEKTHGQQPSVDLTEVDNDADNTLQGNSHALTDISVSGRTALAQQFGSYSNEVNDRGFHVSGTEQAMRGRHRDDPRREKPTDIIPDPGPSLSQGSGAARHAFIPIMLSTKPLGDTRQPMAHRKSRDVDRDDASSFMRELYEEYYESSVDDVTLKFVESLNTPSLIHTFRHASTTADVMLTDTFEGQGQFSGRDDRQQITSLSDMEPSSTDAGQASFRTSDTTTSRISGLSDFPSPPSGSMPTLDLTETMSANSVPDLQQKDSLDDTAARADYTPPADRRESFNTFGHHDDLTEML